MSSPFTFDHPPDRSATHSLRWEKYAGREVIPLWVADMDFPSPPAVIEALQQRVSHGVFGYTVPSPQLEEAVATHLWDHYRWQIEPSWLVWLPGLVCGLNVACRAVGEAGAGVLTNVPIYPPFLTAPGNVGRRVQRAAMTAGNDRWTVAVDALEAARTDATRLFLFCNPHNPTGRVFSHRELTEIAAFCERHDLIICSDEVHCDLVLDADRKHRPTATLAPEVAARCITLMAPSKTFNLPGLGCSFAVISAPRLRARFQRAMQGIVPHVNLLAFTAALAAYRDGEAWRRDLITYLRQNRDLVAEEIARMPGLSLRHVEATYLAWIDARQLATPHPQRFFEQSGVGLSDGEEFGAAGFVRLNFGCDRGRLRTALKRMRGAVEQLR